MRAWLEVAILLLLSIQRVGAAPPMGGSGLNPSNKASCSSKMFGVPKNKLSSAETAVDGIPRGGEVLEPTDLDDVETILLQAGAESQLVVIDFSATWCGPCQVIAPLFKKLSERYPGVIFVKVDVDENPETAAKYSVSAMPTFVFIKYGEVVDRLMGANSARLEEMIEELQ